MATRLVGRSRANVFLEIYRRNEWGDPTTPSGTGSTAAATETLRVALPELIRRLGVGVLLDAPCGEFSWVAGAAKEAAAYVGVDIVEPLVAQNRERNGDVGRTFLVRDIVQDRLPEADLVLSRDSLVHLSYRDIWRALSRFQETGARYLLTTTFPNQPKNHNIATGQWRPLNLEKPPFSFPAPLEVLNEGSTELGGLYADKSLGLWSFAQLAALLSTARGAR